MNLAVDHAGQDCKPGTVDRLPGVAEVGPPPDTGVIAPPPLAALWGSLPAGPAGWLPAVAALAIAALAAGVLSLLFALLVIALRVNQVISGLVIVFFAQGLTALWREGLLARAVLQGQTRGYRHHPQLIRFQAHPEPLLAALPPCSSTRYLMDRSAIVLLMCEGGAETSSPSGSI